MDHDIATMPTEGTSTAPMDQDSARGKWEEKGGENKKKKGKLQYLFDREKNIKKNCELLALFFKEINEWKEEEQAAKTKKKEGKKTTKVEKEKEKDKLIRQSTQKSKE